MRIMLTFFFIFFSLIFTIVLVLNKIKKQVFIFFSDNGFSFFSQGVL